MTKPYNKLIIISLVLALSSFGCKKETPPPAAPPKPVVAPPPPLSKVVEEGGKKVEKEAAKRNPFKPFIAKGLVTEAQIVEPQYPLQRYEISALKLVAVIWGLNGSVAMVETPDGKGYTVRNGDLVGNKGGKVSKVLNNQIIIEEKYKDYLGTVQTNEIILALPAQKGEELR